jgi:Peptidase family M1 domain
MEWDDTLPSVVERTGFYQSFHMAGQWFPKIAVLEPDGEWKHFPFHHLAEFYADFGTYDVTITAPKSFTVGATGTRTEEPSVDKDGRASHHFRQEGVHDFAFMAWDKAIESTETIEGVRVRFIGPMGSEGILEREKATLRFAMPYFRAHYGVYPYETLTVVHPPEGAEEAGGMEYPTLITTGGSLETPSFVRSIEHVTLHEFGHEYFYGLLASNELESPFLDEGLNSYAEQDALAAWGDAGDTGRLLGLRISDDAIQSVAAGLSQHDEVIAKPASDFQTGQNYGRLVYARTAQILETTRRVFGKDAFVRAMKHYAETMRFTHPTREDFFSHIGPAIAPDGEAFLRTAFTTKGWIDYAVVGVASGDRAEAAGLFDEGDKRTLRTSEKRGEQHGSVAIVRRGTLILPVEVRLDFSDGSSEVQTLSGLDANQTLSFSKSATLLRVTVDPLHKITLDAEQRNNVWGETPFPARTSAWFLYGAQAILGLLP